MMLEMVAVGKLKDKSMQARCDEYVKWLGAYGKATVTVLPDSSPEREGEAILRLLERERTSRIIALAEEGRQFSSTELAEHLAAFPTKLVFVVGGPLGLSAPVKRRAHELWSLSRLTFTHEMARLLVLEQLFRVNSILHGGKYHHAEIL